MMYRITIYNRETDTRISQKFKAESFTVDDLMEFLINVGDFSGPHTLTDWDIIDIHEINEEVTSA